MMPRQNDGGGELLAVEELSIAYSTRFGEVPAVNGVSLRVGWGESLGVVGESGCGKSTLALAIMAHITDNARVVGGRVRFRGQDLASLGPKALRQVRGGGIAMVYQEPAAALNPSMRIGEQIAEAAFFHAHVSWREAHAQAAEMLGAVGIPDVERILKSYPHQLSGGQQQRAVIAMALLGRPSLLILDEPTTNLDVTVEASVVELIGRLRERHNMGLIYSSQNLGLIAQVCERVAVMYAGEIIEEGGVQDVFRAALHPYTSGLLRCIPRPDMHRRERPLRPIPGQVVQLRAPPEVCAFAPRCEYAVSGRCDAVHPPLAATRSLAHKVRCLRWAEIGGGEHAPARAVSVGSRADEILLTVRDLDKYYALDGDLTALFARRPRRYVKANEKLSFRVRAGQTTAIVGESGCGKSTFAKVLMGLEQATGGSVRFEDIELANLPVERRTPAQLRALQIVFQNPDETLNPFYSIGAQIGRVIRKFRIATNPREMRQEVRRLLSLTGLPPALARRRPHQLSGGQKQRVAIARAFAGRPRMVVADEPVSSLDVSVRAAITELLTEIQRNQGTTLLMISHDLGLVRYMADRVVVMYLGQVMESGTIEEVFSGPYHPYTEALLSAIPVTGAEVRRRIVLEGEIPSALSPPRGCPFHTRCHRKIGPRCTTEKPTEQRLAQGSHRIVCHIHVDELARIGAVFGRAAP